MKRIIFEVGGDLKVAIPAPHWEKRMNELAAKVVPSGVDFEIVEHTEIPVDRVFRGAWKRKPGGVDVDMPKARLIHKEHIALKAAEKLERVGKDVSTHTAKARNARSKGDAVKEQEAEDILDTLADEMERLAELKENFDVSGANTPEELKALYPPELQ